MKEKVETLGQLKESLSPQAKVMLEMGIKVYENHKNLGEAGKKKEKQNQFGDMAMTADVGAETKILESSVVYSAETGKTIEFLGEESGNGVIINGEIQYWLKEDKSREVGKIDGFQTHDGIDGSENYVKKTDWPYGTMVASADKADSKYRDFNNAAVTMEEEGWVVLATKDSQNPGVFIVDLNNSNVHKIPAFNQNNEFNPDNIIADN